MRILLHILIFFAGVQTLLAQDVPLNSQIFLNPYYYNPAFAGFEDRPAFNFYYRQQWTGIQGAPNTVGFNFHTIFKKKINFGVYIMNDKRSILNTSRALVTFGYRASFGDFHYISFALSGGVGFNTIDLDAIDPNDPALVDALDNNLFLDGNAGINYYNNGFNLGISLPRIFKTKTLSNTTFDPGEISPLNDVILMTSYKWEISEERFAFEPYLVYFYKKDLPGQFEVIGRLIFADIFSIGASYRQDYGITALIGLNINDNFKFGYAYEFFNVSPAKFNNGSHDLQLSFIIGKGEKKGRINMIEKRRSMLRSMGKLHYRQKPVQKQYQVEKDPFEEQTETYSEEQALNDLLQSMNEEETFTTDTAGVEDIEPQVQEDTIDIFNIQFDEEPEPPLEVAPQIAPPPKSQPKPEISEEKALIRQIEEEAVEEFTFIEEDELKDTTEVVTEPEVEEYIEPTLDEEGLYIGPTEVVKGNHLLELEKGNYVVVGTFGNYREAEEYSDQLFIDGYYTKFGYVSQTKIY